MVKLKSFCVALVALFSLILFSPAYAVDSATAVATCGAQSLTAGFSYGITQDLTGTLCTAGGAGGTSYTVNYGSAIGTKGTPGGFKDGSGNFQSFVGSVTNGLAIDCGNAANTLCGLINSATPAGANRIGYTSDDPCTQKVKTVAPIATSSGNVQLVAPSGSTKVYVCSLSLIAAATAVVNIIEGTGATCTTANEAAIIGSTTAGSGMSLAANGGLTLGNGAGTIGVTATAANGVCLLQSGTTALAGNITYVQQ